MKKQFLLLGLLTAITAPAFAEGVYVFGELGKSNFNRGYGDGGTLTESDKVFGAGAGYSINKYFAVELGYRDFGSVNQNFTSSGYPMSYTLSSSAVQFSLLGKLPVSDSIDIYGRWGDARLSWESKDSSKTSTQSDYKPVYGAGASYNINEKFSLRGEYSRYSGTSSSYTSALTLGATYSF